MYKQQLTSEIFEEDSRGPPQAQGDSGSPIDQLLRVSGFHTWKLLLPNQAVLSTPLLELLQLPPEATQIPLQSLIDCWHADDRGRFAATFDTAVQRRTGFSGLFRLARPEGASRVLEVATGISIGPKGSLLLSGVMRDATESVTQQAVSISRNRLLRDIIGYMPSPVVVLDHGMRVLNCSTVWLRCHRMLDRSDAVGQNYYALFPETLAQWRAEHDRAMRGEPVHTTRSFVSPRTGAKLDCQCMIRPWYVAEGRVGGIVMLIGWSEFGVAKAAQRSHVVDGFGGSLLDMLSELD